jgi:Tol biopolymer transport system component
MWSPDGRKFVFCSNRGNSKPGETNVFIAEWKD